MGENVYLKPHRGSKYNAEKNSLVLKNGEIFFEIGNNGIPSVGRDAKAIGKIKMGDGTTTYENLGYFIDVDTTAVDWDNTGYENATAVDQGEDLYEDLNNIEPNSVVKSIFRNNKSLLYKLSTKVTDLYNDFREIDIIEEALQTVTNKVNELSAKMTELYNDFGPNQGYSAEFLNSFVPNNLTDRGTITSSNVDEWINSHIKNGRFYDIRLGETLTIQDGIYNKSGWTVVGFNTELNKWCEDGVYLTKPHIGLISPPLLVSSMNHDGRSNYYTSDMNSTILPIIANNLKNALGNHLLDRGIGLGNGNTPSGEDVGSNGYDGLKGAVSDIYWTKTKANLLTEREVFGSPIWTSSAYETGLSTNQLPLFKYKSFSKIIGSNNSAIWFRDLAYNGYYVYFVDGISTFTIPPQSRWVVVYIIIG